MRRLVFALVLALTATGCDASDSSAPPAPSPTSASVPAGSAASFVAFADGGAAPRFDDQVEVFVGDEAALTLTGDQAGDAQAWTTDDGSLLELASAGQVEVPSTCGAMPSPAVPMLHHEVDVRGVSVLWRPDVCDFAVLLVIDKSGEIAGVAFTHR